MRFTVNPVGAVFVLSALLLTACSGDGGGSSPGPRVSSIPRTLRGFLMARGVPQIYSIAFADQELDEKGVAAPAQSIRRVESWTWIGAKSTRALFDSGFLVEEAPVTTALASAAPPRSPTDFHGEMTPDDIKDLVGASYTEETGTLGQADLTVRRYPGDASRPPQAFGFVGGKLTSVVVGVAMEVN